MNARTLIAGLTLAAALPMSASAVVPAAHARPLESCAEAVQQAYGTAELADAVHDRRADGRHEIYANIVMRDGGEVVPMRVTCQTSTSGSRVMDLQAQAGRWVEAGARG